MISVKSKASRAAYRKIKKDQSQQRYLESILTKSCNGNIDKLEKSFNIYNVYNPEVENIGNFEQAKEANRKQVNTQASANIFFQTFENENVNKKAHLKVERERINIERENYKLVISMAEQKVSDDYNQLVQVEKKLQQNYISVHQKLQQNLEAKKIDQSQQSKFKQSNQSTLEIENLKKIQSNLEKCRKEFFRKLSLTIGNRNQFICQVLKNGYYQQNGLLWIFQQIQRISQKDSVFQQHLQKLSQSTNQNQNPFQLAYPKLKINSMTFPKPLDQKSIIFLIEKYEHLKTLEKEQDEKNKSRLKKSVYLFGKEKFQDQNLRSSLQILQSTKKINYDIKKIYKNTQKSIEKWVKDKFEGSQQSPPKNRKKSFALQKTSETKSIFRLQTNQSENFKNFVFSNESTKNYFNQYLNGDIKSNKGNSLPLIENKSKKIQMKQIKAIQFSQCKKKPTKSYFIEILKTEGTQQSQKTVQKENSQKFRIVRIYQKNHQQKALRLIFGISQSRQQILKMMYS